MWNIKIPFDPFRSMRNNVTICILLDKIFKNVISRVD